jgi:hypothetical protein
MLFAPLYPTSSHYSPSEKIFLPGNERFLTKIIKQDESPIKSQTERIQSTTNVFSVKKGDVPSIKGTSLAEIFLQTINFYAM